MKKSKKNWSKKIFWSESIRNVSKRNLNQKSRNRNFFPITKFFLGLSHFLAKIVKNGKVKKFWSESIQNFQKRILKQKSQNRKFYPV